MTRSKALFTRNSAGDIIFSIVDYIILILFMFICVYPFYYVFINSIGSKAEITQGILLWPRELNFETYAKLLTAEEIPNAFLISLSRSAISTATCILFTSMLAYLLTQKDMFGRKFVYRFCITTMYVSGGLIPWFITMKAYHLQNSFLLYVVPGMISAFYVILVKTYIESVPISMEESAKIDGAGFFITFFKVIFPLARPIVATVAVYQMVGAWNVYMDNYLLVTEPKLQTMQMVLYNMLNEAQAIADQMKNAAKSGGVASVDTTQITPVSVRNAATIISIIPIMCVYPLLQKNFAKGLMIGAIKG